MIPLSIWFQVLWWVFVGSVLSLIGGIVLALRKKPFTHNQSMLVVSFAAGVLLSTAILDLLPEAMEQFQAVGSVETMWWWLLSGVVFLFLLEKLLIWYHHHHDEHTHRQTVPLMITAGDTIHNMIDGIVIAASFIADPKLGVVTALAVAAHEIPHEMGDFGVLLAKGWGRWKTIFMNMLSACASFAGAVGVLALGSRVVEIVPALLAFSAGSFLYLACSDLIPELHHECEEGKNHHHQNILQIIVFGIGIFSVWYLVHLLE